MRPLILIPARLGSIRLPGKPLAMIAGKPMISHVYTRALAANTGPVYVATDAPEIAAAVEDSGGKAIMTARGHESGSDRIAEALAIIDPRGYYDIIVNVQGDEPLIEPEAIHAATALMTSAAVDIGTLGVISHAAADRNDPGSVKIIGEALDENGFPAAHCSTTLNQGRLRAQNFTRDLNTLSRAAVTDKEPVVRHIGLYAWRRAALQKFCCLPRSARENHENLEQLRALDAGMRIDVALIASCPRGVDTAEDLERVRKIAEGEQKLP